MYCGSWKIDDLLTFTVTTHRFDTGAATDADGAPAYRVYEDETGTAILTGTMALLDSSNTAGFYSEQITLSAANGFEKGKSYNIYISAAVNSVTGATSRTFQIEAEVDANVVSGNVAVTSIGSGVITATSIAADAIGASELAADAVTEIQSGLATAAALTTVDTVVDSILSMLDDARGEPGQGAPAVNPDAMTKLDYLYKAWRNKKDNDGTENKIYADDGSTVDHKQTTTESGGTVTVGEVITGA